MRAPPILICLGLVALGCSEPTPPARPSSSEPALEEVATEPVTPPAEPTSEAPEAPHAATEPTSEPRGEPSHPEADPPAEDTRPPGLVVTREPWTAITIRAHRATIRLVPLPSNPSPVGDFQTPEELHRLRGGPSEGD